MILLEMDQRLFDSYSAKLILFGEYLVLLGAESLAIPFDRYNMRLLYNQGQTHPALIKIKDYILNQLKEVNNHLYSRFDVKQFETDLQHGIAVQSTIPMGAGMGSSGALIALLYKKYVTEPAENLSALKQELAQLESCYHGTSSGIDPLVIYLHAPIHMVEGLPHVVEHKLDLQQFFIFNSGVERNTEKLVHLFKEKLKTQPFHDAVYQEYLSINNQAIQHIIQGKNNQACLKKISLWQYEHMAEFIPLSIKQLWETGLSKDSYYLKLCGAGGGGYFLGYSVTTYPNSVESIRLI